MEHRAKRPKVGSSDRYRVAKACSSCRRLKEKCDGGSPCSRCARYGRTCGSSTTGSAVAVSTTAESHGDMGVRMAHLESIARHFLGKTSLETENLQRVVQSLEAQNQSSDSQTSPDNQIETYSIVNKGRTIARPSVHGFVSKKLSHLGFARTLQDEVYQRLKELKYPMEPAQPPKNPYCARLLSNIDFRRADLPPKGIALFLSGVYFDFAHTGCFWVERPWIEEKIERLYDWTTILSPDDHAWICSVVLILAVAVLYARLAGKASEDVPEQSVSLNDTLPDHDASLKFYRIAAELVPDLLLQPSVDALQAFVLFGHFALSWNAPGLAYDYFGVASHIVAQIDLPQALNDARPTRNLLQTHHRLRQVTYIWEERIGVHYGIAAHKARAEINEDKLQSCPADTNQQQISPEASTSLMLQLTGWLRDIACVISEYDQCDQTWLRSNPSKLMDIRRRYKQWWSSLNISQIPILQLNRFTAPLHLCHHLNVILIGRSLIAGSRADSPGFSLESQNIVAELVDDAEYSAYEIIDICAMLDESTGLAAASYVEFSTCQAAVLVMLAQSLIGRCHLFRGKLELGMELMRKMERNQAESTSEMGVLTSIHDAINALEPHKRNQKYKPATSSIDRNGGYRSFQNWAKERCWRSSVGPTFDGALMRHNGDPTIEVQGMFSSSPFDSSMFDFDPNCLMSVDQRLDVY